MASYNMRNPGVRRLLKEAKEMHEEQENVNDPPDYVAFPLEDNLFEWHFTIRGPVDTPFEGGEYHGRIILPPEYPMKPPSIVVLTPNGRFQVGEKICLSITGYHPEYWQPAWGVRTVCMALISIFPSKANGAIGGLDWTDEERRLYAKISLTWKCPKCAGNEKMVLRKPLNAKKDKPKEKETERTDELKISFTYEKDKKAAEKEAELKAKETSQQGENQTDMAQDSQEKGKQKEQETQDVFDDQFMMQDDHSGSPESVLRKGQKQTHAEGQSSASSSSSSSTSSSSAAYSTSSSYSKPSNSSETQPNRSSSTTTTTETVNQPTPATPSQTQTHPVQNVQNPNPLNQNAIPAGNLNALPQNLGNQRTSNTIPQSQHSIVKEFIDMLIVLFMAIVIFLALKKLGFIAVK